MSIPIAIDRLPSLPQVLIQILDAIHSDSADFQSIANIIRHDAAITAKLIHIANSSFYTQHTPCTTIERALFLLGMETVKTVVITTAMNQFFNNFIPFNQRLIQKLWRRSFISANFAQVLATLTSYHCPDEAYLCGLLSDIGQLVFLAEHPDYQGILEHSQNDNELLQSEYNALKSTHCNLAAELATHWQLGSFMADALRYHHEDALNIQDTHHLVKIINLASQLSAEGSIETSTLQAGYRLFGLTEPLIEGLRDRIQSDFAHVAKSFEIDLSPVTADQSFVHAQQQLASRLNELSTLAHVQQHLWQLQQNGDLHAAICRTTALAFNIQHCLLFTYEAEQQVLTSHTKSNSDQAELKITLAPNRSYVADTLLQSHQQCWSLQDESLSIIDQQLLRHFHTDYAYSIPLSDGAQYAGVLVLGLSEPQQKQLHTQKVTLTAFASHITKTLLHYQWQLKALQSNSLIPDHEHYVQRVKEAVHEASNPLSIIRNYLATLHLKLGENHEASGSIELIKEEIDRIGHILLAMRDTHREQAPQHLPPPSYDINQVVSDLASIFRQSLCLSKDLTLNVYLDKQLKPLAINTAHLRQILTNLVKNACEALSSKGVVSISTETAIFNSKNHVAITVQDNGPGIPDDLKPQLFSPVKTTKGNGHSGLGLSIVKKLVDEMGGAIIYRHHQSRGEGTTGTQFQILLPVHSEPVR